jgi:hypothetical protein
VNPHRPLDLRRFELLGEAPQRDDGGEPVGGVVGGGKVHHGSNRS